MDINCFFINNHSNDCLSLDDWKKSNYEAVIATLSSDPYKSSQAISDKTFRRLKKILTHSFANTSFFKEKFNLENLSPSDFKFIDDIKKFPITHKQEVLKAVQNNLLADNYKSQKLFHTRTCGTSSGKYHNIYFDKDAVIKDTLQGIQQLYIQSRWHKKIEPHDIVTHYYVYPWWTNTIDNQWKSKFIASDTKVSDVVKLIKEQKPAVIGGYPSNIKNLMPYLSAENISLKLIITNSEFSTRAERDLISKHFGCPVLDEYSSEELTRIALEMPDGNYYVCSDSVYLEVVDPTTGELVPDGTWGEAVATSLLNMAMPYIRYATGDWVKKSFSSEKEGYDGLNWPKLSSLGGRIIDSLVSTEKHSVIPQSEILESIDQKHIKDHNDIKDYRIYQYENLNLEVYIQITANGKHSSLSKFRQYIENLLKSKLGQSTKIEITSTTNNLYKIDNQITNQSTKTTLGKKRRRIQFLGDIQEYLAR